MSDNNSIPSFESISEMWFKDSYMDVNKLQIESLKTASLHHKYSEIFYRCNLLIKKTEEDLKKFKSALEDYLSRTMCTDEETSFIELCQKRKIGLPDLNKRYLKPEIPKKVESHSFVIQKNLEISELQERSLYLKSILAQISGRSFQIRDAVEFLKFQAGG